MLGDAARGYISHPPHHTVCCAAVCLLQVSSARLGRRRAGGLPARNITCLCFNGAAAPSVLKSMAEFSGRGSTITLVARWAPSAGTKQPMWLRVVNRVALQLDACSVLVRSCPPWRRALC